MLRSVGKTLNKFNMGLVVATELPWGCTLVIVVVFCVALGERSVPSRTQTALYVMVRSSLTFAHFFLLCRPKDWSVITGGTQRTRLEKMGSIPGGPFSEGVIQCSFSHCWSPAVLRFWRLVYFLSSLTPQMPPTMLGNPNGLPVYNLSILMSLVVMKSLTNPSPDWSSGLRSHDVSATCISIMSNTCLRNRIYWLWRGLKYWFPSPWRRKLTPRIKSVTWLPTE